MKFAGYCIHIVYIIQKAVCVIVENTIGVKSKFGVGKKQLIISIDVTGCGRLTFDQEGMLARVLLVFILKKVVTIPIPH